MGITKVTRNYQVTLPKDIREQLDIREGDKVMFIPKGESAEVVKVDKEIIEKTYGLWKNTEETGTEYVRRMRKEWRGS